MEAISPKDSYKNILHHPRIDSMNLRNVSKENRKLSKNFQISEYKVTSAKILAKCNKVHMSKIYNYCFKFDQLIATHTMMKINPSYYHYRYMILSTEKYIVLK